MPEKGRWVYVIPLRSVYWGRRSNRADRAVRFIRQFIARHTKVDDVIIMSEVNNLVWSRGREKPPRRVKVVVDIVEEKVEGGEGVRRIAKVRLAAKKFKPGSLEVKVGGKT
ncbi:MAG: 50S ribosomal protein L31e [Acidilobaceae archaeon]